MASSSSQLPMSIHVRFNADATGYEGVRLAGKPADPGWTRYVLAERLRERVMRLGGFQRTERGGFWIDRDDVLRLLDEEAWRTHGRGIRTLILPEPTDEMIERVMEAVAEAFGACSRVTAERIIAAAFSTSRSTEEADHG